MKKYYKYETYINIQKNLNTNHNIIFNNIYIYNYYYYKSLIDIINSEFLAYTILPLPVIPIERYREDVVFNSIFIHERMHSSQVLSKDGFEIFLYINKFIEDVKRCGYGYCPTPDPIFELAPTLYQISYVMSKADTKLTRLLVNGIKISLNHKIPLNIYKEIIDNILFKYGVDGVALLALAGELCLFSELKFNQIASILEKKLSYLTEKISREIFNTLKLRPFWLFDDVDKRCKICQEINERLIEFFDKIYINYFNIKIDLNNMYVEYKNLNNIKLELLNFILKYINRLNNVQMLGEFIDILDEFTTDIPVIIYYKNKYYIHAGKNVRKTIPLWMKYFIDWKISQTININRALYIKYIKCPFSYSDQFERCRNCSGLIYPEVNCKRCKYIKDWLKSEGLMRLYCSVENY